MFLSDMPTGRGLIIAGWTVFGVLYTPNLIWGITAAVVYPPSAYFLVPVFGPIIGGSMALATGGLLNDADSTHEPESFVKAMGAFLLIWGLLEGGALTMAIFGHLRRARYRAAMDAALEDDMAPEPEKVGFRVTPWATGHACGLGVSGWF